MRVCFFLFVCLFMSVTRKNPSLEINFQQAKRHLESTLHRLQAQGMATMDDHTFSSDEIPQTIHTNGIIVNCTHLRKDIS